MMSRDPSTRTIVTILSTSYAGSHFLSLLLGSHSQAAHLGEVHHLRNPASASNLRLCHTCDPDESCLLFRDLTPERIDRVYDIIFRNLERHAPNVNTLIDTSKRLSWAARFIGRSPYRYKYIHLIRDPRALCRRWMLNGPQRNSKWALWWKTMRSLRRPRLRPLIASESERLAYKWLILNRRISTFIQTHHLDQMVVSYHDLATQTDRELKRLMEWIDLEHEPSQLQYWKFQHHGSQKPNYKWIKNQQQTGYLDLHWKEFLPETTKRKIAGNQDILTYASDLQLTLTENGLVRQCQAHSSPQPCAP